MRSLSRLKNILLFLFLAVPAVADPRYFLEVNSADLPRVLARYSLTLLRSFGTKPTYLVSSSGTYPPDQLLNDVRRESGVAEFEPDTESKVEESRSSSFQLTRADIPALAQDRRISAYFGASVRTIYPAQNAAALIGLGLAQQRFPTGVGVVAVIDTGIDPTHPALRPVLVNGYDFTRDLAGAASDWPDLDPAVMGALAQSTVALLDSKTSPAVLNQSTVALLDQSTVALLDGRNLPAAFGHGTMVAGLIHLAAPTARIMPLKAFRADGTARLSDIVRAIYYAVDKGAKVINMSFSMAAAHPDLVRALDYAASKKVVCLASAGNQGKETLVFPAGLRHVIGVGSTDLSDQRCLFSNYGSSNARTAAPGEMLVTTYPGNNYAVVWGTSFSTALASGAVLLMQDLKAGIELGKILDAFDKGQKVSAGMGDARVDLYRSLSYLCGDSWRQ